MRNPGKTLAFLLLAAGLAVLFLRRPDRGEDPRLDVPDDVRVCIEHLRSLHDALVAYQKANGALPPGTGAAFLSALLTPGILEDTPAHRALLACPAGGGYAVRDFARYPLARFPTGGAEPILACDDAEGMNHPGVMNILYADKSVRTVVLAREIADGRVPPGTTVLRAGPDAPLPDLRKLRLR